MTLTAFKTQFNIRLGDNDDFAFTPEEKESLLTEAIQDAYVVAPVTDDTLTFTQGTWEYELPDELTTVTDILVRLSTLSDPEPIGLPFDIIERTIRFKGGSQVIPTGTTLYLKGNYKYTVDDDIEETRLQDYILNLAQVNSMDEIGIKKIMKFVKNDTSIAEMVQMRGILDRKVVQQRAYIQKSFQTA